MRDNDIGDVLVVRNGKLHGIVTDRDLVVRVVAAGLDPERTNLDDICSAQVVVLAPDDSVNDAIHLMREHALRRLPVVGDDGKPLGIVSMGDLAVLRDPESALADVSAAPPNT
jgi:CBS domain-containing protein